MDGGLFHGLMVADREITLTMPAGRVTRMMVPDACNPEMDPKINGPCVLGRISTSPKRGLTYLTICMIASSYWMDSRSRVRSISRASWAGDCCLS